MITRLYAPSASAGVPAETDTDLHFAARASAFEAVRFAMKSDAGLSASRGKRMPREAPPAPMRSTRAPSILTPCDFRSAMNPAPSVLSPEMAPSRKMSVLTAPAASARGERLSHMAKASSLNGTVTLQPLPPSEKNFLTASLKPSRGARIFS